MPWIIPALIYIAVSIIMSVATYYATKAMAPKPKAPNFPNFADTVRGRTILIRSSIASHQIIYGQVMVSGTLVGAFSSGNDNEYLHYIVALAGHEVEEIGDIYLEDTISTDSRFTGLVRINKHLGTDSQTADTDLVSEIAGWTTNHRLRGIAYVYVRLKWDQNVWLTGLPNIRAVVKGRKVYDPRTATTGYSNNAALCQRDYLRSAFGINATATEIDESSWIAAANICDEAVPLDGGGTQARYTCNGTFYLDQRTIDVMEDLLVASAGTAVYREGKYFGYAGAYSTPGVQVLNEDDLRGPLEMVSAPSRRELFNSVRGTYVSPTDYWQGSDFPPYSSATYVTEDNDQVLWMEMDLPFTTNSPMAQRLARIYLERSRRSTVVKFPAKYTALPIACWETVKVSIASLGWTEKVFRVTEWALAEEGGIDLILQEEDTNIYAWSAEEEALATPVATNLPDPWSVASIAGLTVQAGQQYLGSDGTIHYRLKASWTASTDQYVVSGGRIEVEYKLSTDSGWSPWGSVPGSATAIFIEQVRDGVNYDVRVRPVNQAGVVGAYTTVLTTAVGPDTTAPDAPTGVTVTAALKSLVVRWTNAAQTDLDAVQIWRAATNDSAAAALVVTIAGTAYTDPNLVPGTTYYYWLKSRDTSGNLSAFHTTQFAGVSGVPAGVVTADVATGLKFVEVLGSLPAFGTQGRTVFLTTDNKLYRDTGAAWTAVVPTTDLSGQITTTQITDSAVTTDKINANAVTAAKIAANTITASQIAAGTITTTQIAADTILAGNIAAGAIGASEIAANVIDSSHLRTDVAVISVSAQIANAVITNAKIGNLEVDSAKIANLTVGTGKIAAGAVTNTGFFENNDVTDAITTETEIGTLTISTDGGAVALFSTVRLYSADTWAVLRLRKDSTSGTILSSWIAYYGYNPATMFCQDSSPASSQTYKFTADAGQYGYTVYMSDRRMYAINQKK